MAGIFSFTTTHTTSTIYVRSYRDTDHEFVLSLAPRLLIGMPAWRDHEQILQTIRQQWLVKDIEQIGTQTAFFIAEDEQGEHLGFACVSHQQHFSGEKQAYLGELAISEASEGYGIGQALVQVCEQWARDQGYLFLVLDTGAANVHARGFYQHLGFLEEEVKLVKRLQ